MKNDLYIRQKRMNCSLAVLEMAANRLGKTSLETYRNFVANRQLSLYSPGDICKSILQAGFNPSLLECPTYKEICNTNKPAIAISFLVPMGHFILIEKPLPDKKLLVSDPLGRYPYGRGDLSGNKIIYSFDLIARDIGMPYWFILFENNNDISFPLLSCGYAVSDITFRNKSLVVKNGDINYLSREVNTTLGLNPWQGWNRETIRSLAELCDRHNVEFKNQVTAQVASLIIKTFIKKWRRLNSKQVK